MQKFKRVAKNMSKLSKLASTDENTQKQRSNKKGGKESEFDLLTKVASRARTNILCDNVSKDFKNAFCVESR